MNNANACAYPCSHDRYEPEFGLTKRELFAAMALQGCMASHLRTGTDTNGIASDAVKLADALLAELEKEPTA